MTCSAYCQNVADGVPLSKHEIKNLKTKQRKIKKIKLKAIIAIAHMPQTKDSVYRAFDVNYNKKGQLEDSVFFNANGSEIKRKAFLYNRNTIVETAYFKNLELIANYEYYHSRGKLIEAIKLYPDPAFNETTKFTTVDNQVIQEEMDYNGALQKKIIYTYFNKQNGFLLKEKKSYNKSNELIQKANYKYNNVKQITKYITTDLPNKTKKIIRYKYDTDNKLKEKTIYNDGNIVDNISFFYNDLGHKEKEIHNPTNGKKYFYEFYYQYY